MPEYTYLVETRLSTAQQKALATVRDVAREAGMVVFLAGGAVRDLTTGSSVRDLDFAVQGNALDLKKALEARGASVWGSHDASRTLYLWFPGSVRVEVSSTRKETFPKPGKPAYEWSGIIDDLHRRDFTANAMAVSLNEGSYGLLLDPLNGVADIEARHLRLVSNYGFLEDPLRLVRAIRLCTRLGWTLEERTQTRYENAKEADHFNLAEGFKRGYELEEIAAEEDALRVIGALEAEGWMAKLAPEWTSAKADTVALENLHKNRIQLLMQNITADLTAAHLEVLTAKMSKTDRDALKARLLRKGLVAQWEGLAAASQEFGKTLTSSAASQASATWKLFHESQAEPILWLAHTRKGGSVEQKFKNLFTVWPEVAKQVPVALMLEMRITPELPGYDELLHALFLQQIDGKLDTPEAMRTFLEPYSPPAPPPPITLKRTRSKKSEGRGKKRGSVRDDDDDHDHDDDEDDEPRRNRDDEDDDHDDRHPDSDDEDEHDSDDEEDDAPAKPVKPVVAKKPEPKPEPAKAVEVKAAPVAAKTEPAKKAAPARPEVKAQAEAPKAAPVAAKSKASPEVKAAQAKPAVKAEAKKAVVPAKAAAKPVVAKPVAKTPAKAAPVKAPAKAIAKKAAPAKKQAPAKKATAPVKKAVAAPKKVVKPAPVKKTAVPAKKVVAKKAAKPVAKPAKKAPAKKAAGKKR